MTRTLTATVALALTFAGGVAIGAHTREVSTLRATNASLRAAKVCALERAEIIGLHYELRRGNAQRAALLEAAGWMDSRQPGPTVWLAHESDRGMEAGSP